MPRVSDAILPVFQTPNEIMGKRQTADTKKMQCPLIFNIAVRTPRVTKSGWFALLFMLKASG
jgi:hypothetical protein